MRQGAASETAAIAALPHRAPHAQPREAPGPRERPARQGLTMHQDSTRRRDPSARPFKSPSRYHRRMVPGPIDIEECARTLIARMQARQDAARARAQALRAEAALAGSALMTEFGAKRVWLFGSLAWGEPHEASDVDLLVEGLAEGLARAAERRVGQLVSAGVDLVRVEDAPPGLADRVRREGALL